MSGRSPVRSGGHSNVKSNEIADLCPSTIHVAFMLSGIEARTYWAKNAIEHIPEIWPIAKRTPGLLTA
ncbi:hypothetical protein OKW35_003629 [Paraburkholderia sp. MM5477-R1]